jgi:hypothetical protein
MLSILLPNGMFMAIWYILWSFGIFFPFWYAYREKSGNPELDEEFGRGLRVRLN